MSTHIVGPCAEEEELMRLVDGQLSVEASSRIRAHAAQCMRCRNAIDAIETLASDLRAPVAIDEGAMVAALMKRIEREAVVPIAKASPSSRRKRAQIVAGAVSLALAAAAVFALVPSKSSSKADGAYAARGDGTPISIRKGASITFTTLATSRALEAGAVVEKNALLGADYRNVRTGASTYLLAFAIDSKNTIHWIYPAYEKAGTDPESVLLIAVNGPTKMPTSALLDSPAEGTMRLVSILSEAPHHVSEIESLSPTDTSLEALRARWPDAVIDETIIALSSSPSP